MKTRDPDTTGKATRDEARKRNDHIRDNVVALVRWLTHTATASAIPARPTDATGGRSSEVSRPTEAAAIRTVVVCQAVARMLHAVYTDLDAVRADVYGRDRDVRREVTWTRTGSQGAVEALASGIIETSGDIYVHIHESFAAGAEASDLRDLSRVLGDARGSLGYWCGQLNVDARPVRMCKSVCGAPAPPMGEGATCQRCRKRASRDQAA